MTQEERQLLLKDLCGRLLYFVEAQVVNTIEGESKPLAINKELTISDVESFANCGVVYNIKPYLRPMSSMTEEEKKEYDQLRYDPWHSHYDENICNKVLDWLNARQLDYRGLIEKGLALEATEDMYKTE